MELSIRGTTNFSNAVYRQRAVQKQSPVLADKELAEKFTKEQQITKTEKIPIEREKFQNDDLLRFSRL